MFKNPFKKSSPAPSLRDTLFGDAPIDQWPPNDVEDGDFGQFTLARRALQSGDTTGAIARWRSIISRDPMGSVLFQGATVLMQALIAKRPA